MDTHKLVQSMTKAEKRFFRSYSKSNRNDHPKYLLLFDVLCKTGLGDEKKIKKKDFTYYDKSLLMEKILEALHLFHSQKFVDTKIQLLLSQVTILYEKNIWDEMGRRLKEAKELAIDNERLLLLLQAIQIEKNLASVKGDIERLKALNEEQIEAKKQLIVEINSEHLLSNVEEIISMNPTMEKTERLQRLEELIASPMSQSIMGTSTIFSKINYWAAKFLYEKLLNEGRQIIYAEKIIEVCQKQHFVFLNSSFSTAGIFLFLAVHLKRNIGKELNFIDIINNLPTESDHTIYSLYGFILENSTIHPNDKTQALDIIHKITNEENISKLYIHIQIWLIYLIMTFYGTFDNWEEANNWFKQLSSIKRSTVRKNLQIKARVYSLIINYEVNNKDSDIHIQSVRRYLRRNQYYSDTEKYILDIFNELFWANRHQDKIEIWRKFHSFIENTPKLNDVYIPVAELKVWCKSKIEGTTVVELLNRKVTAELSAK